MDKLRGRETVIRESILGRKTMARTLKILVACGSGIATSSVAMFRVEEICKEVGVDAKIIKTGLRDIPEKSSSMDLVLTTSKYSGECSCPVESVVGFLTGVDYQATKDRISKLLLEMVNQ
jgi:PTS system galactitol-specific IIB component